MTMNMTKIIPKFFDEFFYYASYFHDATLIDFKKTPKGYVLEMESAEISIVENKNLFPLSERNTLYGLLHIEGIQRMCYDSNPVKELTKEGEFFEVYHLEISTTRLLLSGFWKTLSIEEKKRESVPPYKIEIDAETIYWENTADGLPPFLLGTYLGFPKIECHKLPYWFCERNSLDIPEHQIGGEGHASNDHYHRENPHSTNRHNECLDAEGNPCGRYQNAAHLYSLAKSTEES